MKTLRKRYETNDEYNSFMSLVALGPKVMECLRHRDTFGTAVQLVSRIPTTIETKHLWGREFVINWKNDFRKSLFLLESDSISVVKGFGVVLSGAALGQPVQLHSAASLMGVTYQKRLRNGCLFEYFPSKSPKHQEELLLIPKPKAESDVKEYDIETWIAFVLLAYINGCGHDVSKAAKFFGRGWNVTIYQACLAFLDRCGFIREFSQAKTTFGKYEAHKKVQQKQQPPTAPKLVDLVESEPKIVVVIPHPSVKEQMNPLSENHLNKHAAGNHGGQHGQD